MNKYKKIVAIASLLSISLLLNVADAAWTAPTATAPGNNTSAPINISANTQTKLGGLGLSGVLSALGGSNRTTSPKFCLNSDGSDTNCITSWPAGGTGAGSGDVKAAFPQIANYLTKWVDASSKTIINSSFYEDATKGLCKGTGASQICLGNGTPGATGPKGVMGSDGTIISCLASESGKVLQWNGTGWICGVAGGATGGSITGNGTAGTIPVFSGPTSLSNSPITVTSPSGSADTTRVNIFPTNIWGSSLYTQTNIDSKSFNISGNVKITSGNPGTNKILASDAVGVASWKTASELGIGVTSYNQLPSGSHAGFCRLAGGWGALSLPVGAEYKVIAPATASNSQDIMGKMNACGCVSGWTSIIHSDYTGGNGFRMWSTCIKN